MPWAHMCIHPNHTISPDPLGAFPHPSRRHEGSAHFGQDVSKAADFQELLLNRHGLSCAQVLSEQASYSYCWQKPAPVGKDDVLRKLQLEPQHFEMQS